MSLHMISVIPKLNFGPVPPVSASKIRVITDNGHLMFPHAEERLVAGALATIYGREGQWQPVSFLAIFNMVHTMLSQSKQLLVEPRSSLPFMREMAFTTGILRLEALRLVELVEMSSLAPAALPTADFADGLHWVIKRGFVKLIDEPES